MSSPELIGSSIDVFFLAFSFEEKSIVFGDDNFADLAEVRSLDVFQFEIRALIAEYDRAWNKNEQLLTIL